MVAEAWFLVKQNKHVLSLLLDVAFLSCGRIILSTRSSYALRLDF